MDIDEVKEKRLIVEKEIARLLDELCDETGLKATNVTLHSTNKVAITLTV